LEEALDLSSDKILNESLKQSSSLGTDAEKIKIYIRKRASSTARMGHYMWVKVKVVANVQRKHFQSHNKQHKRNKHVMLNRYGLETYREKRTGITRLAQ
jgi:hypothetical protein